MKTSKSRDQVAAAKQHFLQREYERCEPQLRRIAQENPHYADVYNMLGVIYHAWGRFADAVHAFEKALHVNAHYTEALLNLAVLYNDLGQYKEAKKLYTQLREHTAKRKGVKTIEPVLRGKLSNMHAEIGDIYFGLGLYENAIAEYARALELNPTYADILTKLGISQREQGALKDSVESLRRACKANGHYSNARVQLGLTYYVMGKTADAKKEWQAILDSDPTNPNAKMYLGLCAAK
ncbi:MAG: tetratricopeptide repeat protein [Deltaproteobacteria bacterium]|nr:tetratricopeptide repeat protein [Deltaproteobacteria bacterium]